MRPPRVGDGYGSVASAVLCEADAATDCAAGEEGGWGGLDCCSWLEQSTSIIHPAIVRGALLDGVYCSWCDRTSAHPWGSLCNVAGAPLVGAGGWGAPGILAAGAEARGVGFGPWAALPGSEGGPFGQQAFTQPSAVVPQGVGWGGRASL